MELDIQTCKDFIYQVFNDYPSIYIFFGAVIGHIFIGYDKDFHGTKPFFRKVFPSKSEVFFERLDALIIPIIALFFSYSVIHPETIASAMSTGLTWNITLVSLINKGSKKTQE